MELYVSEFYKNLKYICNWLMPNYLKTGDNQKALTTISMYFRTHLLTCKCPFEQLNELEGSIEE